MMVYATHFQFIEANCVGSKTDCIHEWMVNTARRRAAIGKITMKPKA